MARGLSALQDAFVRYYIVSLNGTQAAVEAGYSPKYANRQAAQLLAKPKIQAAIQSALEERNARVEVTQDYVIQRLKAEAELEGEGASHGARIKALELLGKHLGMFDNKIKLEGSLGLNMGLADLLEEVGTSCDDCGCEGKRAESEGLEET